MDNARKADKQDTTRKKESPPEEHQIEIYNLYWTLPGQQDQKLRELNALNK